MAQFTLPIVGTLDFPHTEDGYWEFALELAGRSVRIDINVEDGEMSEPLLGSRP